MKIYDAQSLEHPFDIPKSITPSGFFGDSIENIVEIENFISKDEIEKLYHFGINNKIWDQTETAVDKDGLVLYDSNVWENRACTTSSLMKSDPNILVLINNLISRLKVEVEKFFKVEVVTTGPAFVRWPVGARQEPHADKEFHIGKERGRPNHFPHYDIAGLIYFSDDYEGGELYFPQHGIEFRPKAGSAYFFPGDKNYVHGVRPVKSGNRFTCPLFWTILNHKGD